jgi:hypothetical protein
MQVKVYDNNLVSKNIPIKKNSTFVELANAIISEAGLDFGRDIASEFRLR